MSAAQIFYAVRAAAPTTNPFVAIAYTLHGSFYPTMSNFFMTSVKVLHGLYAVQTVILLAALAIRWRRTPGDMWIFKTVSTPRGTYITPHFAVAWQASTLGFLVLLQPYLVMTSEHAYGNDWKGYLGGRTMGFLPAWLSTWLALWSLAVAVCLPRATGRRQTRFSFFSSPTFINAHFIGGIVFCCISIIAPSIFCARLYDQAVDAYRESRTMLLESAPGFANMTSTEVDVALAEVVPVVDRMLEKAHALELSFKISWWMWFIWITYSYGVFLLVSSTYFSFIMRSMKRVAGLDSKDSDRNHLRRAWLFASLTSVLVTLTGLIYAGASLAVAIWTHETITSGYVLSTLTLITLYGFGILGLFASALSLAQSLLGSSSSSNIHSPSLDPSNSTKPNGTRVHVTVQTRTDIDRETERERNVVQLELADWQRATEEKEGFVEQPL